MEVLSVLNDVAKIFNVVYAGGKALKLAGVEINMLTSKKKERVKEEVSIIIDFNKRSIVSDVEKFLAAKKIDSTIFVCKNPNENGILDLDDSDQWRNAVEGIYKLMSEVDKSSPKKWHIFMNAPGPLLLALGYVLRPDFTPYIYQFDNQLDGHADSQKYSCVLRVNDSLKG